MNREKLFDALADVDEAYIAEALRYSPEAASGSSERIVHLNKKKIISFALAAVLILALGAAAYAVFSTYSARVPERDLPHQLGGKCQRLHRMDGREAGRDLPRYGREQADRIPSRLAAGGALGAHG